MFLQNFHIFKNKRAMLRQKFTVQVTTLPDYDDITRFDGTNLSLLAYAQCTLATIFHFGLAPKKVVSDSFKVHLKVSK